MTHQKRWPVWLAMSAFHILMVLAMSALSALLITDAATIGSFAQAQATGQFELRLLPIFIHVGLVACAWAFGVIGFSYMKQARQARGLRVVKLSRGTALTETLIVLFPFLLLTSGLAQMGMMNIAAMLCDLGAYQGARAAWIWMPETQMRRVSVNTSCDLTTQNSVCNRARTAVAFAVAPSAPSNYYLGSNPNPSNEDFKRARGVMTASFGMTSRDGASGYNTANRNTGAFGGGERGTLKNVTFSGAFDTHGFSKRASRKVTNAFVSLEQFSLINSSSEVGVRFTYKYQLVFPWFGWIWGQKDGFSDMYYLPINREFTLSAQPNMR